MSARSTGSFARTQRHQRGLTLVELMISLLIGMVVVGAVLAAYVGSGTSSRHSQAMSQMTEDASVALNVLRTHVAMAGFSRATGVNADGTFVRVRGGRDLFGCDGPFDDVSLDMGTIGCAGTAGNDSVAVAYEADGSNDIVDSTGVPLDCLGAGLTKVGTAPNDYYESYSRFYVDQPEGAAASGLYCRGSGGGTAQALVENIESLELTYGLATVGSSQVIKYVSAADMTSADYDRAVSVRVCVVVASSGNVMDTVTPYQGCDPFAEETTPADGDRRAFRAFTSTIVLHNRL